MERQGPHTPLRNIYLSSWLDGLNDHPAEKGEGKKEKESLRRRGEGMEKSFAEEMCHRESRERAESGKMLTAFHLEGNKAIRMT